MNETRVRIFFIIVFAFSLYAIITGTSFYPSVRFPQFQNKKMGKQISYSEVKLFNCQQKMEVNLMSVIQPFDKQFYLFSLRALANEKTSKNALAIINNLYRQKNNTNDSLCFSVQINTIEMP